MACTIMKGVYGDHSASNAEISTLFTLFSIVTEIDPPTDAQQLLHPASHYFEVATKLLHLDDILSDTTVDSIEAMSLMVKYIYMTRSFGSSFRAWNYLGITMRLAFSVRYPTPFRMTLT